MKMWLDRTYVVYKGKSIPIKDLKKVMKEYLFEDTEEKTFVEQKNDVTFLRNNEYLGGKTTDLQEYLIHKYNNYTYIFDKSLDDIGTGDNAFYDIYADPWGGMSTNYEPFPIFDELGLNDTNYYELLPILLENMMVMLDFLRM